MGRECSMDRSEKEKINGFGRKTGMEQITWKTQAQMRGH
jgi:hypothetical protein